MRAHITPHLAFNYTAHHLMIPKLCSMNVIRGAQKRWLASSMFSIALFQCFPLLMVEFIDHFTWINVLLLLTTLIECKDRHQIVKQFFLMKFSFFFFLCSGFNSIHTHSVSQHGLLHIRFRMVLGLRRDACDDFPSLVNSHGFSVFFI